MGCSVKGHTLPAHLRPAVLISQETFGAAYKFLRVESDGLPHRRQGNAFLEAIGQNCRTHDSNARHRIHSAACHPLTS